MGRKPGARTKLRAHFLANIGRIMGSDELRNAAGGITEWARRVRELRNEEGYQIQTHNDRADLKPGEYILADPVPKPAFERAISKESRAFDTTRKTRLHIGHIVDKSQGGSDDPTNLRALCSVCNEGASNLTLERPSAQKLLIQVRRARGSDQVEVLRWLIRKFPERAKEMIKTQSP